jgi:hypothetical protein
MNAGEPDLEKFVNTIKNTIKDKTGGFQIRD